VSDARNSRRSITSSPCLLRPLPCPVRITPASAAGGEQREPRPV